MSGGGFTPVGPRLRVINPAAFMTYCSGCGQPFRKGTYVRRAEGGYGYLCEKCAPARAS